MAIDYPGFGSSEPLTESPTFDRLAELTGKVIDALGIGDYAIYMFDFGAPVGSASPASTTFECVASSPKTEMRIRRASELALSCRTGGRTATQVRQPSTQSTLAGTQSQWNDGARDPEQIDPEQAIADQRVLDLPGRAD